MLSDQLQLNILSRSSNAIAIYDSIGLHIRFVSEAMLQIWGKERSIVGKTLEEAVPEIAGQPFINLLRQVWESGITYTATDTQATLEIAGILKTSYFDFEYQPIKDDQGITIAILHTTRDVSGRVTAWRQVAEKQNREEQLIAELRQTGSDMQDANTHLSAANHDLQVSNERVNRLNLRLQESETDFKRLVEQAPVAILVFRGPEMVIDLVNEAMLEILGKDKNIAGKPLLEGLPEIKGAPAVDMLFEVFATGKALDGNEAPVPIRRGNEVQTRYFNFSYRPLIDDGHIIGVMDVAIEVTEQVLARKKLEENERRLQGILDTMAEGVVIVDTEARPTYANAMAQRIMGIDEIAFMGRRYNDAKWQNERVDGSPLLMDDHPIYVVLRTGLPLYDQEVAIIPPDKEKIYISINAAPLVSKDGELTGGILTFTDVTNRRKLMQQKDDFISVASHELKTPVTALKASLQLLERMQDKEGSLMSRKLVEQANRSLNKLSDLISSLLNVNRISQGRFPIHKSTFKIADLINECCQHIHAAGTHNLILKGDLDAQITADDQLLDQVIVNLVNNAVKYAPDAKDIVIEVDVTATEARVAVSDQGPGIPAEKASHIFERYYQADQGSRHFNGLGLGLYIAAEIIEKHGGQIGVDSEPGQGSTFWFTLPV